MEHNVIQYGYPVGGLAIATAVVHNSLLLFIEALAGL